MPEFNLPVDIANRALQRVGAESIVSFTENSNRAAQVNFNYGKLRQAELERNIWTFSTRRAALRPLDINTAILQPALWSSNVTYFLGSIVSDANNTAWKSILRDNLGNQPGVNLSAWVPYFGPLSVSLYDFTVGYFVGELVYTAPGDGTYAVYQSQVSGNGLDPSLPNIWSKLTTYSKDWVVVVYPNWAVGTTYGQGATVLYTDGNYYTSLINSNLANIPPNNPSDWVLTPILQLVPQQNIVTQSGTVVQLPFTVPPGLSSPIGNLPQVSPVVEWAASLTYSIGAFVMFNGTEYVSLANNNTSNYPNAASSTFWAAITGGTSYMSLIDFNVNNNPASTPANWSGATTYALGNTVAATDGIIYTSLQNGNINHNPANGANPTFWSAGALVPWTTTITGGAMNQQWLLIGGTSFTNGVAIKPMLVTYPVGAGPVSQSWTKNVYRLPAGHLRKAPQDPKAGVNSWLGNPGNLTAKDWTFDGPFLITWDTDVIVYRFIANVQDVTEFNAQFCEALSCRIALEICEPLTQSTAKKQVAAQEYKKFLTEAIIIDQIETGPIEPALDDLISTRL